MGIWFNSTQDSTEDTIIYDEWVLWLCTNYTPVNAMYLLTSTNKHK